MSYQSTLSPDCWNRPGFAQCMAPQYVIASQYCEKQGTLNDVCVGQAADELGKSACNCGATPTVTQNVVAVVPPWVWLAGAGVVVFIVMRSGKGKH